MGERKRPSSKKYRARERREADQRGYDVEAWRRRNELNPRQDPEVVAWMRGHRG